MTTFMTRELKFVNFDLLHISPRRVLARSYGETNLSTPSVVTIVQMAGCKDYIILCLDTGPSMDTVPLDEGDTRLQSAVKIASRIVQQKMFAGSKDFVGLVLFGTTDTQNELADSDEGYQHISVAWQPAQPSLEFLQYLTNQITAGDTAGDFLDALVVAMDVLVGAVATAKRVGEKKIYLITDAGSEYTDDGLHQIAAGLKDKDIQLIIVGPDLDRDDSGGHDGGDHGDGSHGDGSHGNGGGYKGSSNVLKKTTQQLAGEAVLCRLVTEVDGASFSFREALQVANLIRKTGKRQTTRFAGHLEIGSQMKIACKIFTKVMHERPATWKKLSAISQASGCPGQLGVRQERSYRLNDEDETEIEPDSIAKGYRYGKSLVPITADDELQMKSSSDRCLSLLGCTSHTCIAPHQTVGTSVQIIVPSPDDSNAGRAMSALIHALYETGNVGIARFVARKNAAPRLVTLLPQIKTSHECLVMVHLPYMEDVRQYSFPSLPGPSRNAEPSADQLTAVDNLISTMDLMKADKDDDGDTCEAIKPKLTMNPLTQRVFQCISDRALNPDSILPDMEPGLATMIEPSPTLVALCSSALTTIKEQFPLMRIEKKKKTDEKNDPATVWKESSGLDLDSAPVKKSRVEEDTDFSMASLARGEVTEVGSLDPVADFCCIINRQNTDYKYCCCQLQQMIMKLVKESFGDSQYRKALDCIRCLRRECLQRSEVEIFNGFLREVKGELIGTRYSSFWSYIVDEGITMVTTSECSVSSISDSEAKDFLEGQLQSAGDVSGDDGGEDEADDLLAMM